MNVHICANETLAMVKLCIVCDQRPAVLPDRARMGRPIKRVCRECHANRLKGDLEGILAKLEGESHE